MPCSKFLILLVLNLELRSHDASQVANGDFFRFGPSSGVNLRGDIFTEIKKKKKEPPSENRLRLVSDIYPEGLSRYP